MVRRRQANERKQADEDHYPPPPRFSRAVWTSERSLFPLGRLCALAALLTCAAGASAQTIDYDDNDNGFIDVRSVVQLYAIRWDLDGNGAADNAGDATSYANAFPTPATGMGCPAAGCMGYELRRNLDFDTDGDGDVDGDDPGSYANFWGIGGTWATTFRGNGHTITNLTIANTGGHTGMFAEVGSGATVRGVGLINPKVSGSGGSFPGVGALAGMNYGTIVGCYTIGGTVDASGAQARGGGLVGRNRNWVRTSYSTTRATSAAAQAGGLTGSSNANTSSPPYTYNGRIRNSYAAASVSSSYGSGGLTGSAWPTGRNPATDSYWDNTIVSANGGISSSLGKTTAELQEPTGYTGIYSAWDDTDGDAWDFGTGTEYPVLKFDGLDPAAQRPGLHVYPTTLAVTEGGSATYAIRLHKAPSATVTVMVEGATAEVTVEPAMLTFTTADWAAEQTVTLSAAANVEARLSLTHSASGGDYSGLAAIRRPGVSVAAGPAATLVDPATPVALPDPLLRAAVERALGKRPGAALTAGDLLTLRSLSLGGAGVSSLRGLEAAGRLERLDLSGNGLTSLSPLAGLPSLTYLDLSDNGLTDVSALSGLVNLRTLLLGGNAVRDLSRLAGLTRLEALTLSGNGLEDISMLSRLSRLEQLWLDGNGLSDISALSALGSLIYLHLGDNRIADISPLASLSALRRLWLPGNIVVDVSALAGLRELRRLDLSRNGIADASPLRGLPRLSWLRLGWNRLADVSPLAGHSGLADGGALGLRGNPLGAAALDTHIPALREAGATVVFGWAVPLFPSAADAAGRGGVARVLNRSDKDGTVLVEAVDEAGQMSGPATLSLAAGAAASFDSADLENGNAEIGLAEGLGPPTRGSWRLLLWSVLDIEVLAYVRTPDGFLTPAHTELPRAGDSLSAFLFNPASNRMQRSSLRVFNPGAESARMSVWGVDDAGRGRFASGFMAPPNAPLALRAGQLERSRGAAGAGLGNGAGKWRLRVAAPWPLSASTFLESPSGHVSNLSPPPLRAAAGEMLRLPLFPAASNPAGREGFARVANMTAAEGVVDIEAVDDAGVRAGPVRLQLAARATTHFNSDDLENGNAKKGLASGVGAPTKGAWRLELRSGTLTLAAATYARHADGFVTSPARDRASVRRLSAGAGVPPGVQRPAQPPAPGQQRRRAGDGDHHRRGRRRRGVRTANRHRARERGADAHRRATRSRRRRLGRRPRRWRRQVAPDGGVRQPAHRHEPHGKPLRPRLQPLRHRKTVKPSWERGRLARTGETHVNESAGETPALPGRRRRRGGAGARGANPRGGRPRGLVVRF